MSIEWSGGGVTARVIPHASVESYDYSQSFSVLQRGDKQIVVGDGGPSVQPLRVSILLQEESLEETGALAQTLIDEAKKVVFLDTPLKFFTVDGLVAHRLSSEGLMVRLVLEFVT